MSKRSILVIFSIIIIIIISISLILLTKTKRKIPLNIDDYTPIYLYDLGSSKINIIKKDGFTIVINSGASQDKENLLDYFEQLNITKIDYLVLPNNDASTISNTKFITENYQVDYIYMNEYNRNNELETSLNDTYSQVIFLTSNELITINNFQMQIIPNHNFDMIINQNQNTICLINNDTFNSSTIQNCQLLVTSNDQVISTINHEHLVYDGQANSKPKNTIKRNVKVYLPNQDNQKVLFNQ